MSEAVRSIADLRDRLSGVLTHWGDEVSRVLDELEQRRSALESLETQNANRNGELENLEKQLRGHEELIETLTTEAAEAGELRRDLRARELEVERLTSERDSKQDLIRALRRDADQLDRLKTDLRLRDGELAGARQEAETAKAEAERLRATVESYREEIEAHGDDAGLRRSACEVAQRAVRADRLVAERRHDHESDAVCDRRPVDPAKARTASVAEEHAFGARDRGVALRCWNAVDHATTSIRPVASEFNAVTCPRSGFSSSFRRRTRRV
jgi:chromosome segregation ATPase